MTCSTLQTVFSAPAGAQGRRKGQSRGPKPGRKLSASQTCWRSANATGSARSCLHTAWASPSLPSPSPAFSDLLRSCPAPPPAPTWRSAQVAVRWSVTPGTGSREGGANARGGDCAGRPRAERRAARRSAAGGAPGARWYRHGPRRAR